MVLVPGQNMWKTLRGGLFGIFGVMTYLVGPFLLYLAYLLATGYRVALFAGKVSLMGVLCASVPVIFSKLNIENLKVGEIVKMLFTRGGTYFWEGGVLGAPIGATLLALFGRPASNIIMLLIFLLGLMFFFAITPADVVLFVDGQYKTLQAKRAVIRKTELTDMQKLSVCMANGEKLMPSDYLRIKRDVLKLGAIVDKYRDPIGEYEMEFKRSSDVQYTLSCTYAGKPLTLTFDKKSWGTWNIGTWRYDGEGIGGEHG